MQTGRKTLLAIAAMAFTAPAALADNGSRDGASEGNLATEFKGRPPFARHAASTETADLARFEETAVATTARHVDFRGRPPYSRHGEAQSAEADLARFEETDSAPEPRRWGPPGKMNSQR